MYVTQWIGLFTLIRLFYHLFTFCGYCLQGDILVFSHIEIISVNFDSNFFCALTWSIITSFFLFSFFRNIKYQKREIVLSLWCLLIQCVLNLEYQLFIRSLLTKSNYILNLLIFLTFYFYLLVAWKWVLMCKPRNKYHYINGLGANHTYRFI